MAAHLLPTLTMNSPIWLATQAIASVVRAMVTMKDTWGQRYGVVPGYGINMQDGGFEDVFS